MRKSHHSCLKQTTSKYQSLNSIRQWIINWILDPAALLVCLVVWGLFMTLLGVRQ